MFNDQNHGRRAVIYNSRRLRLAQERQRALDVMPAVTALAFGNVVFEIGITRRDFSQRSIRFLGQRGATKICVNQAGWREQLQ
jgi:hypothetical protein